MSFRINTNPGLFSTNLQKGQKDLSGSLERLATGQRINKASDDASGLAIANRLSSQVAGYDRAMQNASEAAAIAQIADAALNQAVQMIQDIRVKAVQAGSGANSSDSLAAIQADIDSSLTALSDLAQTTSFNGQPLLSGRFTGKDFQIGADAGQTLSLSFGSIDPAQISDDTLGPLSEINVTTPEGAQKAVELADMAIDYVSRQRSKAGASQSQLESTFTNLSTARINTLSARSQINDLDFAEEAMNLNRMKILQKARTFAQAQANTDAGRVIDLLG